VTSTRSGGVVGVTYDVEVVYDNGVIVICDEV
jgi:hypothetical protein